MSAELFQPLISHVSKNKNKNKNLQDCGLEVLLGQESACLVGINLCVRSQASPITWSDGTALRKGMQEDQKSSHPRPYKEILR